MQPFAGTWKKQLLFPEVLSLCCVIIMFSCFGLSSGSIFSDNQVLLEFKNSVYDPSGLLSSWGAGNSSHCSWFGVSCDGNSRVLELKLRGNSCHALSFSKYSGLNSYGFGIRRNCSERNGKLIGKLSPVFGKLTELRVLSLPFNELAGEIPRDIWRMKNLEILDLEANLITGDLSAFKGLRKLQILNLGFNDLVGEIPVAFSECRNLKVLNLSGNRINGVIPGFIGGFKNLKGLYLPRNRLIGSLPDSLGDNCQQLEHMDVSGNFLKGEIPLSLGNCSRLRTLLLSSNALYGVIPPEFGGLPNLQVLDVSRNKLSGPIPARLGHCVKLSVVVLSNHVYVLPNSRNQSGEALLLASGTASDEYNSFEGSIPEEITMLPMLKILWAPGANLKGSFPSNWSHCNNLEMVNLAQNSFTGNISRVFEKCRLLYFLNVSSNSLSGQLDGNFQFHCLAVFDVSANHISGSIPTVNYSSCSRLPYLNSDTFGPFNPFFSYPLFFEYTTHFQSRLPVSDASVVMIHNTEHFLGKFIGFAGMVVNVSNNKISGLFSSELGLTCRFVKALDASVNEISGSLPQNLGDFESLVVLDLSWNKLHGQIPVDLGQMKHLKYFALAGNNLTGTIPPTFDQLQSLEVLDLSSNSLYGEIPQGLVNLRNLTVLLLDNNKFSGKIPLGLAHMTSLAVVNVSFNNLSGPLLFGRQIMNCSSFIASCSMASLSLLLENQKGSNKSQNSGVSPSGGNSKSGSNGINSVGIALIVSASAVVGVILALVVLFFCTKKRTTTSRVQVSQSSGRGEIIAFHDIGTPLTLENVVRTTGNFNASNCIGTGGFGSTYKAEISPGITVAVKRLTLERCQGLPQFGAEVRTLGRIRHPNLITLIGYFASEADMFLVYNYLPGGNLEKFIQNRAERAFNWGKLHKIALDVASALSYLHDQSPRVLHRDVKPSNILLDNNLNAYLSDFGLARILGISETHVTTGVHGTFGYLAPEYALTCRVSEKADVYSYGVVLLELLSDKKALDPSFSSYGNGFNIVSWACMLLQHGQVNEFFTAGLWDASPQDHLVDMLLLAVSCTGETLSARPKMKQVVQRLKRLQPLSG